MMFIWICWGGRGSYEDDIYIKHIKILCENESEEYTLAMMWIRYMLKMLVIRMYKMITKDDVEDGVLKMIALGGGENWTFIHATRIMRSARSKLSFTTCAMWNTMWCWVAVYKKSTFGPINSFEDGYHDWRDEDWTFFYATSRTEALITTGSHNLESNLWQA